MSSLSEWAAGYSLGVALTMCYWQHTRLLAPHLVCLSCVLFSSVFSLVCAACNAQNATTIVEASWTDEKKKRHFILLSLYTKVAFELLMISLGSMHKIGLPTFISTLYSKCDSFSARNVCSFIYCLFIHLFSLSSLISISFTCVNTSLYNFVLSWTTWLSIEVVSFRPILHILFLIVYFSLKFCYLENHIIKHLITFHLLLTRVVFLLVYGLIRLFQTWVDSPALPNLPSKVPFALDSTPRGTRCGLSCQHRNINKSV